MYLLKKDYLLLTLKSQQWGLYSAHGLKADCPLLPTLKTLITQVTMKMKPDVLPNPCHLPWCWAWVLSCAKEDLALLPNQTWVHSPNIQQLQHTTYNDMQQLGCGEGKYSVYCKAPKMGPIKNRQLMLKRPKPPDAFQGRFFKNGVRERITGSFIRSCTIL